MALRRGWAPQQERPFQWVAPRQKLAPQREWAPQQESVLQRESAPRWRWVPRRRWAPQQEQEQAHRRVGALPQGETEVRLEPGQLPQKQMLQQQGAANQPRSALSPPFWASFCPS